MDVKYIIPATYEVDFHDHYDEDNPQLPNVRKMLVECINNSVKNEAVKNSNDSRVTIEARQLIAKERKAALEHQRLDKQTRKISEKNVRLIKRQIASSRYFSINLCEREKKIDTIRKNIDKKVAIELVTDEIKQKTLKVEQRLNEEEILFEKDFNNKMYIILR